MEDYQNGKGADLRRGTRQRGGNPAGNGEARYPPRRGDGSDLRARSGERLSSHRLDGRPVDRATRARSQGRRGRGARVDGGPCRGDRTSVGSGKGVAVRVELGGGGRIEIQKKTITDIT